MMGFSLFLFRLLENGLFIEDIPFFIKGENRLFFDVRYLSTNVLIFFVRSNLFVTKSIFSFNRKMRYCTDVIPEDGLILSRHVEGEYCLGWNLI